MDDEPLEEHHQAQRRAIFTRASRQAHLLTLKVTKTATVSRGPTSTTATSAPSTIIETSTTASSTTSPTVTATTTTEAATTSTTTTGRIVVARWAGGRVVKANRTAQDESTAHLAEDLLSFFNGAELNVSEALGIASVHVGRQTNAENIAMLSEFLSDCVFSRFEGKVGDKYGVAGWAQVVSEGFGAVLTLRGRSFRLGEVDIDGAAIDLGLMHSFLSLDAVGGVDKLDVAISSDVSV